MRPYLLDQYLLNKVEYRQVLTDNRGAYLTNKIGIKRRLNEIKENSFEWKPLSYVRHNTFLDGYWQSYKYFEEYDGEIRSQYALKTKLANGLEDYLNIIDNFSTCAIHIRRGDYLGKKNTHGLCTKSYYLDAINYMSSNIDVEKYIIFTDDEAWVKNDFMPQLKIKVILVDRSESINDAHYLTLMSSCQHQVIANSTFSWWAAYLNKNKSKAIIAPKRWFANEAMEIQTSFLIPPGWIRL